MMNYQDRVELFILYLYDTGIKNGEYLRDVPFRNLAYEHRQSLIRTAKKVAKTKLIPKRKYIGNTMEWRWELVETK